MTHQDTALEQTPYRKLDPKAKKSWLIGRLLALLLMAAVAITAKILLERFVLDAIPWYAWAGFAVLLTIQAVNTFLRPLIQYRQWAYRLTADRIEIKKGIFFHTTQIIPISRIQHVTVTESPLARILGLAGVTIMTAGSSMSIEGLAADTARALCDHLKTIVNQKVYGQTDDREEES